jgi:hypothetical protein
LQFCDINHEKQIAWYLVGPFTTTCLPGIYREGTERISFRKVLKKVALFSALRGYTGAKTTWYFTPSSEMTGRNQLLPEIKY